MLPARYSPEHKQFAARHMVDSDKRASERAAHGETLTAISDGLVGLLKVYYGRGPYQAKT
jgi:hypothetical protein